MAAWTTALYKGVGFWPQKLCTIQGSVRVLRKQDCSQKGLRKRVLQEAQECCTCERILQTIANLIPEPRHEQKYLKTKLKSKKFCNGIPRLCGSKATSLIEVTVFYATELPVNPVLFRLLRIGKLARAFRMVKMTSVLLGLVNLSVPSKKPETLKK